MLTDIALLGSELLQVEPRDELSIIEPKLLFLIA